MAKGAFKSCSDNKEIAVLVLFEREGHCLRAEHGLWFSKL